MSYFAPLLYLEFILIAGIISFRKTLSYEDGRRISWRETMVVVTPPLIPIITHSVTIFYAGLLLAPWVLSRSRQDVCAIYLLMLPMVPNLELEARAGGSAILRFSSFIPLSVGAMLGMCRFPRKEVTPVSGYDFLACSVVILIAFAISRDQPVTGIIRTAIASLIATALPYFIITRCVHTRVQWKYVVLRLVLSGWIIAFIAALEAFKRWPLYPIFWKATNLPIMEGFAFSNVRGGLLRSAGPMLDAGALGFFLVVALFAAIAVRPCFRRNFFAIVVVNIAVAVLLTQSRGAWMGAMGAFIITGFYRRRVTKTLSIITATCLATILLLLAIGKSAIVMESLGITGAAAGTADYRADLFHSGLRQFYEHPLSGQSPAQLKTKLVELIQGQQMIDFVNSHLFVAMTTGVLGLFVWSLAWIYPVGRLISLPTAGRAAEDLSARELPLAILVVSLLVLTFTSLVDRNLTWLILGVALSASADRLALVPRIRSGAAPGAYHTTTETTP